MKRHLRRLALAALAALAPAAASAKVTFTGYADLRYTPGLDLKITGQPATLSSFSLSEGEQFTRSFSANAIGLFATTELQEDLDFRMDLTFRAIGETVGQTRIQYAYLNWAPWADTTLRAGKITLPFGYYNENKFYGFQRYGITPPIFQTGILGLPIADWGASAAQRLPLGWASLEAAAYTVNGYGHVGTSKNSLRSASLPGGLVLANNFRSADNNHKPAVGGRLRLIEIAGGSNEVGASYYAGNWDDSGLEPMYLAGAHARVGAAGFELLVEALHLAVRGDQGFAPSIGAQNWTTDGGFATLNYADFKVKGKALVPHVQYELYRTRPNDGGTDREVVRSWAAGLSYQAHAQLRLKAECLYLIYVVPDASRNGNLRLGADGVTLAAVLTF